MIIKFTSWERYLGEDTAKVELHGPSPGGAAAMLNVSRQTIHEWIDIGLLDYVEVWQSRKFEAGVVPLASIRRLQDTIKKYKLTLGRGGRGSSGVLDETFRLLNEEYPDKYARPKVKRTR